MNKAIFPGSFDPITYGHIDIIKRSAKIFDEIIVVVLSNCDKNNVFSVEERIQMIEIATKDINNVIVKSCSGLTTEFAIANNAKTLIRGLRNSTDFDYEHSLAEIYNVQADLETVFLATSKEYNYLSSTVVREFAAYKGDISNFVPKELISIIENKYNNKES